MKFLSYIKKNWQDLAVVALSIGFFITCAFFIRSVQSPELVRWSSPDETANYFFSKHYAETGELFYYEDLNLYAGDIVYPRSMRSDNGMVKPVSFLGLPILYGNLASWYTPAILPYLTPFFASLGIIFFYLLVKKIFGKNTAFFSACLLSVFPVYFYYSVRSFFHNVLFVDFLIAGLYFSVLAMTRRKHNRFLAWRFSDIKRMNWGAFFHVSLAGFLLGYSLTIRASEALWLLPVLGFSWLLNIKRCGILKLLLFVSFAFTAFLPQLYWNKVLYGDFRSGGYAEMNKSISVITQESAQVAKSVIDVAPSKIKERFLQVKKSIFVFGLHPDKSFRNFNNYFVRMLPWLFWPAIFGLILFLMRFRKHKKKHWVFLFSWLLTCAVLVSYYGSWQFNDNPNPKEITIGNSYTRYWLPVYLGAIPFAVLFLLRFTWAVFTYRDSAETGSRKIGFFSFSYPSRVFSMAALRSVFVIVVAFLSCRFVFYGSGEGLVYAFSNRTNGLLEYRQILELTENSAVVVTQYHDKWLFPSRRVIVASLGDQDMNKRYKKLIERAPLYYYNFEFPEKDFEYLNERRLSEVGLRLTKVSGVGGEFALYRLENK